MSEWELIHLWYRKDMVLYVSEWLMKAAQRGFHHQRSGILYSAKNKGPYTHSSGGIAGVDASAVSMVRTAMVFSRWGLWENGS